MKLKIGIIEDIHEDGIKLLENQPDFDYEIIKNISKDNLIKRLPEFDAITLRNIPLGIDILPYCKKLKVVSRHGVGFDNVDTKFLKENNIKLLITASANAVAVAEHVMFMILNISKGKTLYDNAVRSGDFRSKVFKNETFELSNKHVLIIGFGRIGKNLIKKLKGFDMKVSVYDPFIESNTIESFGGTKIENLDNVLSDIDIFTIHTPLNSKTKNLITLDRLNKMKKNTVIINTARGGIINENDLDKALNDNIIFAAGLDVFEKEPPNLNNPLLKNNKVLLSPHSATFTKECSSRMSIQAVQNIIDFFKKKIDDYMVVKL
tara:strand:- start:346 stop:1305 length:960 start_codon:yes stop_codon:yes gene_type:complete